MAIFAEFPVLRCWEQKNRILNADGEQVVNKKAVAKDLGLVAVAAVAVFALGYFSKLTTLLVQTPYIGSLAGRFTTLPFVSQAAILGLISAPGLALGLGTSLAVSAVMAAVKAKTILTFFNLALQLTVGVFVMSQWNAEALKDVSLIDAGAVSVANRAKKAFVRGA